MIFDVALVLVLMEWERDIRLSVDLGGMAVYYDDEKNREEEFENQEGRSMVDEDNEDGEEEKEDEEKQIHADEENEDEINI